MSVLDAVAEQFDSSVQARGRDYFRRGLVEIVASTSNRVVAHVQGGELYEVEIRWKKSGQLDGDCTCPYSAENGPCKHLWAAMLEAEKRELLPRAVEPEVPDVGLGSGMEVLNRLLIPASKLLPPGDDDAPTTSKAPAWKRQLADLRRAVAEGGREGVVAPRPWPSNRRIAYVVNADNLESDGLDIELATQVMDRVDHWATPKQARLMTSQVAGLPDERDRVILQMLVGKNHFRYYSHDQQLPSEFLLLDSDYEMLLRRMCETGRCFVRTADDGILDEPLQWDDGRPWEFWLALKLEPGGERYELTGEFRRDGQVLQLNDPVTVRTDGLLITANRVSRFEALGAATIVEYLRDPDTRISLAVQQGDQLLAELLTLSPLPKLDLPEELQVKSVTPAMRPRLKIGPPKQKTFDGDKLFGTLSFEYDGRIVAEGGSIPLYDPKTRTLLRRDLVAERNAAARLDDLKFKTQWSYDFSDHRRRLSPSRLNRVVLQLCSEGWLVEAEGKLYRQPGEFKVEVRSGIDWFELEGTLDFGGVTARLPALLAALRRGEKTVQLGDGTVGILPDEWLNKYGLLARMTKGEGDEVRFARRQVGLLDALISTLPQASFDAVFEQARQELRGFEGVEPMDPPTGFVGTLRPYQRQGIGWLHFLNRFGLGGCLADDMGLGKTVQVLSLLEARRGGGKPSLVVVPRSLIFNWVEEAKRFAPQLRILDHTGIARARSADQFKTYDVILTTYGTLRLDVLFLKDFAFDYAILDEAQAIKNGSSESAKAARLIRADHRLVLSGTPIQNHLGELWSLFEFLNPGMLGSASVFKITGAGSNQIEKDARELLSRALRPLILRRTKEQVAPDLPAKTEQTIWCELEPEQRKLYDELRDHYRKSLLERIATEGINKAKIQVLEALLRLRQAACHPGLIDKDRSDQSSAKLDSLLPQIAECLDEGHKVLVFSQFTSFLSIVKKHLDKQKITYEYLDGKTRDRQEKVERFQNDPECKLFLISLKAGGLGLNLTAAEYVFLLDPWWNPAVESQAIDRAHRIGQTRHVFAYRLIAKDTVEQKVLELQAKKKDLADMILNADSSLISQMGREDLELLLS